MRAVVLERPGDARITTVPDPEPGPGELILAVSGCGMCGTDVHIYDGDFPPTPYPIIPGHEFAGRVVAVGPGVDDWTEGEPVVADCTLTCGTCRMCRTGSYNLCTSWGATGDTIDGAFAEYVRVPVANAYRWPDELDFAWAPLAEPLACVVRGAQRLGPVGGTTVLIVGSGVIGALAGRLLRGLGATRIDVCERADQRRHLASTWADHVVPNVADAPAETYELVVDATGAVGAIEAGIERLGPGGRYLLLGVTPENALARFAPYKLFKRELTLLGSMSKRWTFQPALEFLERGLIELDDILEEPEPLESYVEAIGRVRAGEGMKTVLAPH